VFSLSSLVSLRVFNCSDTTPNVNNANHANPPFSPNRLVKNVAMKSVESARLVSLRSLLLFVPIRNILSRSASSPSFIVIVSSPFRPSSESSFKARLRAVTRLDIFFDIFFEHDDEDEDEDFVDDDFEEDAKIDLKREELECEFDCDRAE